GTEQGTVADLSVEWASGLYASRRGELQTVCDHFDRATRLSGTHGWPRAAIYVDYCTTLAAVDPTAVPEALLNQAVTFVDELDDCGGLRDRLLAAARTSGRRSLESDPRRRQAAAYGLSEREIEVLLRLTDDASLRDVADDLYVSINTLKSHTRSIYRKLGVSNRADAAQIVTDWQYPTGGR
ncbi:MAG: LuxR C-terminal-related transcriptional regulator, partial [Actinomycetota bacterium]